VVGDGALGTWAALRDVYPNARRQGCWVHAIANVLDCLPKRLQPRAKQLLHQIMEAPTRADAALALERLPRMCCSRFQPSGSWGSNPIRGFGPLAKRSAPSSTLCSYPPGLGAAEHLRDLADRFRRAIPRSCGRR
jgi:hypothetical protein